MNPIKGVEYYVTIEGRCPFQDWFDRLNYVVVKKIIVNRVNRLRSEHYGNYRFVGEGIWELKISFGPGYRIYYGVTTGSIVILLCGGDKSTQERDIRRAKFYWKEFIFRKSEKK